MDAGVRMPADLRIQWAHLPFMAAAVVVEVLAPRRLFGAWWMGAVLAALAAAVALALSLPALRERSASGKASRRLVLVPPLGYPLLAGAVNSVWPLAVMLPAGIFLIRWRAVRIQTGHEAP